MPFINGRYYMNPAYGRALEAAREAEERNRRLAQLAAEREADPDFAALDEDDHWITKDHRHIFIEEKQGRGHLHPMSLSKKGIDFIARHEGFSTTAYKDQAGYPTVGYGHKILPGEDFSGGVTRAEALELLERDAENAVREVNAALSVPISQSQFDALVDLAFNEGPGSVAANHEVMGAVNSGHVAEGNFTAYRYAHINGKVVVDSGLVNRRVDEYRLYAKGTY